LAEQESVSINQLITLALAEKLSALITEEYLDKRAERGNRKKFERAMAKVPKVKPRCNCSGFRQSTRGCARVLAILPHGRWGPAANRPRQLLFS
jgi:hypothetical protein